MSFSKLEVECRNYIENQGVKELMNGFYFLDDGIKQSLKEKSEKGTQLKKELISILKGEQELTKINQERANKEMNNFFEKSDDLAVVSAGFLPYAVASCANMDFQIKAIDYLSEIIEDEEVFNSLFETSLGKFAQIGNVHDHAKRTLGEKYEKNKKRLLEIAETLNNEDHKRITALEILSFKGLKKSSDIYELVAGISKDESIIKLYEQTGELTSCVKSRYAFELRLRKDYPGHKERSVEEFVREHQRYFNERLFHIIEYVLKENPETIKGLNSSSKITEGLCGIIKNYSNCYNDYYAKILSEYVLTANLSAVELELARNTLTIAKNGLNESYYGMSNEQRGPTSLVDKALIYIKQKLNSKSEELK